jgi:hypothetical protein
VQLLHDTRNGDTAVLDGFLQDFALVWHIEVLRNAGANMYNSFQ